VQDPIVKISVGPGNVFVYAGTPSASTLVASNCPAGPAADLFGTQCPAGAWVADDYRLIRLAEVWDGTFISYGQAPAAGIGVDHQGDEPESADLNWWPDGTGGSDAQ
jgi:hypothetical protein